jgi:stage IV sporulation protein B
MLTTIAGGAPREYDVVIEKVLRGSGHAGQNMVIRVTDEALLQKTGGILQGMSGSPLVQNGMLVGAVTHVFVDEPDRGYAIFAETVRNAEKNLDQTTRNAA